MVVFNGKDYFDVDDEIKISNEEKIEILKQNLKDTDYKAIKYVEGVISEEDYAETKALRQSWRDEINRLESEEDQ